MADSIWYKLGKAVGKGLVYAITGAAAAGVLALLHSKDSEDEEDDDDYYDEDNPVRKTTGHPKLPIDLFEKIYNRDGEAEAVRILDKVQRGEISVDYLRKVMDRPGIDPEDWRDFEDGWRPEGW